MNSLARALRTALTAGEVRWGDAAPPAGQPAPGDPTWEPYVVLWCPIRGGSVSGTLARTDDFDARFQLTGWGRDADEARLTVEAAHDVLMAATLAVAGRAVQYLRLLTPGDGVFPDFDTTPPLYAAPRVYGVRLPAAA